jgi:DDE family transposase
METIPKVAAAMERLFGEEAEKEARASGAIQRLRKFTGAVLAKCFVFGFLSDPNATEEQLAETAGLLGVHVTPQAITQRFNDAHAEFLERIYRRAICKVIGSERALAPLLERFPTVQILDSTTISLPPELAERFRGCGGSYEGGKAAVKIQVQCDLRTGAIGAIRLEPGRSCDYRTALQQEPLPRGSLRITDLGYFDIGVFRKMSEEGVFWLSRLQFGTSVFAADGTQLALLSWLNKQPGRVVDMPVLMGAEQKLPCRLIAWRLSEEAANRRRQKLIDDARRKDGHTPTAERLAWCDWTILVTNVPPEMLTAKETAVLYRARWQIELVFKRWKSYGLVAEMTGSTVARQMVRLWARLLGVLLEHWILVCSVWGDARYSLAKVCRAARRHARVIAEALGDPTRLEHAIINFCRTISSTAKLTKRKKPSTFQLLNNPELLDYF